MYARPLRTAANYTAHAGAEALCSRYKESCTLLLCSSPTRKYEGHAAQRSSAQHTSHVPSSALAQTVATRKYEQRRTRCARSCLLECCSSSARSVTRKYEERRRALRHLLAGALLAQRTSHC
jgi:hypothetical protein